jgi:hypothetical protein
MSTIVNKSDYLAKMTGGNVEHLFFHKLGLFASNGAATAPVAGFEASLLLYAGIPCEGVAPTTAVIPDNTMLGSFQQTDPGGGRQKWLSCFEVLSKINDSSGVASGALCLYDCLLRKGSLDATVTTAQTIQSSGSPALTRYTDGLGNQIWVEITTQIGTVATTITAAYTDENGNSHTTQAVTFGGTNYREKTRIIRLPLAAGDKGVKALASVTVLASTTTAGVFHAMVVHPLAELEVINTAVLSRKTFEQGQPSEVEILTDAALCLSFLARSATIPCLMGALHMVEA